MPKIGELSCALSDLRHIRRMSRDSVPISALRVASPSSFSAKVRRALKDFDGSIPLAAKSLGCSSPALRRWIKDAPRLSKGIKLKKRGRPVGSKDKRARANISAIARMYLADRDGTVASARSTIVACGGHLRASCAALRCHHRWLKRIIRENEGEFDGVTLLFSL